MSDYSVNSNSPIQFNDPNGDRWGIPAQAWAMDGYRQPANQQEARQWRDEFLVQYLGAYFDVMLFLILAGEPPAAEMALARSISPKLGARFSSANLVIRPLLQQMTRSILSYSRGAAAVEKISYSAIRATSVPQNFVKTRGAQIASTFGDPARIGQRLRIFEAEGAAQMEAITGHVAKAVPAGGKGDYIINNQVIDHFGLPANQAQHQADKGWLREFLISVDKHFGKLDKGVDVLQMDIRSLTQENQTKVWEHINSKHNSKLNRLINVE